MCKRYLPLYSNRRLLNTISSVLTESISSCLLTTLGGQLCYYYWIAGNCSSTNHVQEKNKAKDFLMGVHLLSCTPLDPTLLISHFTNLFQFFIMRLHSIRICIPNFICAWSWSKPWGRQPFSLHTSIVLCWGCEGGSITHFFPQVDQISSIIGFWAEHLDLSPDRSLESTSHTFIYSKLSDDTF